MKDALTILAGALCLASCAVTPQTEGVQITVKPDRVAQCKAEGGCALLSMEQVLGMLDEAYKRGSDDAKQGLDSNGCRRGAS